MELNTPPPPSQDPDSDLSHQPAGAQPLAAPISPPPPEDLYRRIQSYPFHSDQDYQLGLAAILGHPETPPTASELVSNQDLVLQAQCFYLARRFGLGQIDVEAYKEWLAISQRAKEALQRGTSTKGTSFAVPVPVSVPTPMREQERPSAPTPSTAAAALNPPSESPAPASALQDQDRPSAPTPSTAAAATTLDVKPHAQISSNSTASPTADPAPPYPTSFAEIVDLITQDKPIPGIEEIPTTVLEPGSSKQDRAERRKKPWEQEDKDSAAVPADTKTESTAAEDGKKQSNEETIDVEQRKKTGEGVLKILQPGAIPDSGLVAKE